MSDSLQIRIGQASRAGRKALNQDFHAACVPAGAQRLSKGITLAIADGISSSALSQLASETAVSGFIADYYSTPESWSVKNSASRVLQATNAWLFSQTQASPYRYNKDRGYVCTFSAVIFKAATAHLFHLGDARIYRRSGASLEQLTEDHRRVESAETSYLTRALGIKRQIEIDHRALSVAAGDCFIVATDGVHEYVEAREITAVLDAHADLDQAAGAILDLAEAAGSPDNMTIQIAEVDSVPGKDRHAWLPELDDLTPPPRLSAGQNLDGFTLIRELHVSSRSQVFLALEPESGEKLVIKVPSTELQLDQAHLRSMLMEEWIARRINNPHVLRAYPTSRPRSCLYTAMEYVEGQTLAQWMRDHPRPALEEVRGIIEQIARGVQAFHRQDMIHRDLRPENIMIDANGTARVIDFGSTEVAGLAEISLHRPEIRGSLQYTAPEYFLDQHGSSRSDLFSLGVLCYQMLCGELPYGANVPRARSVVAQRRLRYRSLLTDAAEVPAWLDLTIRKAVQINPAKRYVEVAEFAHALRHPDPNLLRQPRAPLMERQPVRFWQGVSLLLLIALLLQTLR